MVIDEAHNVVPKNKATKISQMLETIASEGRKFDLFLIITQVATYKHLMANAITNNITFSSKPFGVTA